MKRVLAVGLGAALLTFVAPRVTLAHDGTAAKSGAIGEALQSWSFDVPGILVVVVVAGLYGWAIGGCGVILRGSTFRPGTPGPLLPGCFCCCCR